VSTNEVNNAAGTGIPVKSFLPYDKDQNAICSYIISYYRVTIYFQ